MRWSGYYLFTTREAPKDAEIVSHRLMVRAGMIRRVAAGIYSVLPLGWKSFGKLMKIVRRELNVAGSVELNMPAIQPAELWEESGRWERYGKELLRMNDRHERGFCFGPTHEEVITDIVRHDVKSYRQLPKNLYQIQTKFRDEIRPRFGLMRGREFLMKDAYSFHASEESLDDTYHDMRRAYERIFDACQLEYSRVEADSGTIGGDTSHEFMVLADTGESAIASCGECDYSANVERAVTTFPEPAAPADKAELEEVSTPGCTTVADVVELLGVTSAQLVKTMVYETEEGSVGVVIRGDREVNEVKLRNHLGALQLQLAGEEAVRKATDAPVGFAGPVGLPGELRLIADESVRKLSNFVCGANKKDAHLVGVNWGRDAQPSEWADLLLVADGDRCPRCEGRLRISRGIEVGHIFQLGTKYSEPMGCVFTNESGGSEAMEMGCYGLGIGRTVAAAIEQNHDDKGIVWPLPLAPFEVVVIPLDVREGDVFRVAQELYDRLLKSGVDVLLDDRSERPGVKFKDADLIGFPIQVVIGAKSLADGNVEISLRRDGEKSLVPVDDAVARVAKLLE